MGDPKMKIILVAGVLALAIGGFVVVFLMGGKKGDNTGQPPGSTTMTNTPPPGGAQPAGAPGTTPTTTMPGGAPAAPPAPPSSVPGGVAGTAPVPTPAPTAPRIAAVSGLPDPFSGGPKPPKPPVVVIPPRVPVYAIAPAAVTAGRIPVDLSKTTGTITLPKPLGRHAGWIYNSNGQIVAIFEDETGAHAVKVGDVLEIADPEGTTYEKQEWRVKAITPEYLTLASNDPNKKLEYKLKLQGLDTYQGKRRQDTTATTDMPMFPAP